MYGHNHIGLDYTEMCQSIPMWTVPDLPDGTCLIVGFDFTTVTICSLVVFDNNIVLLAIDDPFLLADFYTALEVFVTIFQSSSEHSCSFLF